MRGNETGFRYHIIFYEDRLGNKPAADFLEGLWKSNVQEAKKVIAKLDIIAQHGLEHSNSKQIKGDIREFKIDKSRILYFIYIDNDIILLNGFIKKTQKTPVHIIKQAEKFKNDYISRKEAEND